MTGEAGMVGTPGGSAETIPTAVSPKRLRLWQGTCMGFWSSFPEAVFKRKLTRSRADGSDANRNRQGVILAAALPRGGARVHAALATRGWAGVLSSWVPLSQAPQNVRCVPCTDVVRRLPRGAAVPQGFSVSAGAHHLWLCGEEGTVRAVAACPSCALDGLLDLRLAKVV